MTDDETRNRIAELREDAKIPFQAAFISAAVAAVDGFLIYKGSIPGAGIYAAAFNIAAPLAVASTGWWACLKMAAGAKQSHLDEVERLRKFHAKDVQALDLHHA